MGDRQQKSLLSPPQACILRRRWTSQLHSLTTKHQQAQPWGEKGEKLLFVKEEARIVAQWTLTFELLPSDFWLSDLPTQNNPLFIFHSPQRRQPEILMPFG
jgi:hypothetical protein